MPCSHVFMRAASLNHGTSASADTLEPRPGVPLSYLYRLLSDSSNIILLDNGLMIAKTDGQFIRNLRCGTNADLDLLELVDWMTHCFRTFGIRIVLIWIGCCCTTGSRLQLYPDSTRSDISMTRGVLEPTPPKVLQPSASSNLTCGAKVVSSNTVQARAKVR